MTVVNGALWANDLNRLVALESRRDYVLTEDRLRVAELAGAMEVDAADVRQRLDRGCRAFAAWSRADELVAWLWVSTGRAEVPLLHQDLCFAGDECYGWGAGTLPPHRGRGLFTALLRYAGLQMGREGRRWIWGGIEDSNLPSRRANVAAGYRPIVRVTAESEPSRTRLSVRPADYADRELVRRARKVLGLAVEGCDR